MGISLKKERMKQINREIHGVQSRFSNMQELY